MATTNKQQNDAEFLEGLAGEGFDGLDSDKLGIPYLSITQSLSQAVKDKVCDAGNFINSLTQEVYGDSVTVIPIQFKHVWTERDGSGRSVGRYEVGGIEVEGDSYSGMKNPKTGNKVEDTWMYLVVMADRMEEGPMLFTSTLGNMKYLKAWNSQLKNAKLPSGAPAPMFGYAWTLTVSADRSRSGNDYFSLKNGISRGALITRDNYSNYIAPTREAQLNLLAAPDDTTDSDTPAESKDY